VGREVRRVPADWQHPRKADGGYLPLYPGEWFAQAQERFRQGDRDEQPDPADYMPNWPASERTHFADQTATYEQWLRMIQRGSAATAVLTSGRIMSGVAFESKS
jgi:hypothetical protein